MNRQEKEEWNRGRLSDRQQVVAGRLLDALGDVEDRWIVEAHREEPAAAHAVRRARQRFLPAAATLGVAAAILCGIAGYQAVWQDDGETDSRFCTDSLPLIEDSGIDSDRERVPLALVWTWNPVRDNEVEEAVCRPDWLHLRLEGHPDAEFVREQVSVPEDPAVWIRVLVREKGAVIGVAAWRVVFRNAAWQAKLVIAEEFFEPMPEKAARDRLDRWIREQTSSNPAA